MFRTIAIAAFAVVNLTFHTPVFAQQEQQVALTDAEKATHEALRSLKREMETAFNRMGESGKIEDLQAVLDHAHDKVILAAMNGDLVVGKKAIVDYFNQKLTGPARTVKSAHHVFNVADLATLYGDDTAVAYGTSEGTWELVDGLSFKVNTVWTATMVKENGKWLLASFQFAPSIFDNPVLNMAKKAVYWAAAIVGVVCIIIGFVLGRFTSRKR